MESGKNLAAETCRVQPAHIPLRLSNAAGDSPANPVELKRAGFALLLAVTLTGCAGPSRKQLVQLLHECREANREHLRLVEEYGQRTKNCVELKRGAPIAQTLGPLWKADAVTVCPSWTHPEQSMGSVEMGLGGY